MGSIAKEIGIGILISILATCSGMFIYVEFFSRVDFQETIRVIKEQELIGKVLTLAAIPNLFIFFIFIKKKQDYRARGVLLTTFLIAIATFVFKII